MPGVYIASKVVHAHRWRELAAVGLPIKSTWIYEAERGRTQDLSNLWRHCVEEVVEADALIAYRENGEMLKGVLVEIGAALAANVQVFLVGFSEEFSFRKHKLVTVCPDMVSALKQARTLILSKVQPDQGRTRVEGRGTIASPLNLLGE